MKLKKKKILTIGFRIEIVRKIMSRKMNNDKAV